MSSRSEKPDARSDPAQRHPALRRHRPGHRGEGRPRLRLLPRRPPEQRERAEEILGRVILQLEGDRAHHPEDIQIRVDLADYYAMIGRTEEARAEIDAVRSVLGDDSDMRYRIGCSLELLGERREALQHITRRCVCCGCVCS